MTDLELLKRDDEKTKDQGSKKYIGNPKRNLECGSTDLIFFRHGNMYVPKIVSYLTDSR